MVQMNGFDWGRVPYADNDALYELQDLGNHVKTKRQQAAIHLTTTFNSCETV